MSLVVAGYKLVKVAVVGGWKRQPEVPVAGNAAAGWIQFGLVGFVLAWNLELETTHSLDGLGT